MRELLEVIVKWTAVVRLIRTALFEAFPLLLFIRMFGADGELYTRFAVRCLRIYLSLFLFTCVQKVRAIFLRSIGRAKAAAPLSVLRDILLIVFSVAAPIADVLAIAVTAVVMLRLWRQLKESDGQTSKSEPGLQKSRPGVIVTIAREKAINMIADSGSCVILGRAADYVLRNRENAVRSFIHAPKEYRVKKVMEMYGDTGREGRKRITRSDSAGGSCYRSISGHAWGDPHQYKIISL